MILRDIRLLHIFSIIPKSDTRNVSNCLLNQFSGMDGKVSFVASVSFVSLVNNAVVQDNRVQRHNKNYQYLSKRSIGTRLQRKRRIASGSGLIGYDLVMAERREYEGCGPGGWAIDGC